jgi:CHAT domain-containing protein/tetratricopeptide (TPR) repeat protein
MNARRLVGLIVVSIAAAWPVEIAAGQISPEPSAGAVVEQLSGRWITTNGLQVGDVILSWSREAQSPHPASSGTIATSLDLRDVELEQAPRGPIVLAGRRGSGTFKWTVLPGHWSLVARPVLPGPVLALHNEAIAHRQAGRLPEAAAAWRRAAAEAKRLSLPGVDAWLLARAATEMADGRAWAEADPLFEQALQALPESDAIRRCRLLTAWGRTFQERSDWSQALERYSHALTQRRRVPPETLEAAFILGSMGNVQSTSGKLDAAEPLLEESRKIRESLAPGSLELADSLVALGMLASRRRDVDRSAGYIHQALEIQNRIVPESLTTSYSINLLGVLARRKGDLTAAEQYIRQALTIREKLAPGSSDVAMSLMNLGGIARERGDTPVATDYFERALAVAEKAPGMPPLDLAPILQNVGVVAADRGDYVRAEEYTRRALDIRMRLAPDSLDTALSLGTLGVIAWSRGDIAGSADYHRRALAIQQKLAPKSAETAMTLSNIGMVEWKNGDLPSARRSFDAALALLQINEGLALQYATTLMNRGLIPLGAGDLTAAEADFRHAIEIFEKVTPSSLSASMAYNNLGDIAMRRGDPETAFVHHSKALEIRQAVAPSSSYEAESYHALGSVERNRKALPEAADFFAKAVGAIEAQGGRLGGSQDVQSEFGASFIEYYEDLAAALIDLNRPADAFATIERSRARILLAMIAQRDLHFRDGPGALARDYQHNQRDTDRVYAQLSNLSPKRDAAEVRTLLGRLRELRDDREALALKARAQDTSFADLQFPQPLDVQRALAVLDPGTVALSYSIGKTRSFLFALHAPSSASPSGLSVFSLNVNNETLRSRVTSFRNAIGPGAQPVARAVGGVAARDGKADPASPVAKQAAELYDLLMKPAEGLIAGSQRVMVIPDGALHSLPFAALVPTGNAAGKARYLLEWKPVFLALSATVYDGIRKARQSDATRNALVAFGDASYAPASRSANAMPGDARRGLTFAPLPATRGEVQRIAARFPGSATVHLGSDATEERAKQLPPEARYVHFAVHGFVDARFPLNSALVMSQPAASANGRDNGLLQVWEVFEQMRLGADLVTLSACETALGQELGGEGLLGLTRAFHYAGARSVVASLWRVADDSTAELMTRFYGHLASGVPKADALRAAQLDLLRAGGKSNASAPFAHPFHWAAFQVFGDWR